MSGTNDANVQFDAKVSKNDTGRIDGFVVVETYGVGLGGYTVLISGQSTITRNDGSFSLEGVTGNYDAFVVGPRADVVRMFMGLTRRNPIFPVIAEDTSWFSSTSKASITGTLSGEYKFPLEWPKKIDVYFLAGPVFVNEGLSQMLNSGPTYGPIQIGWQTSGNIDGKLIALGREGIGQQWVGAGISASKLLRLTQGDAKSIDLELASLSNTRLRGSIQMYSGGGGVGWVGIQYRDIGGITGIQIIDQQGGAGQKLETFDFEVPDLSPMGGRFCISVSDGAGKASAMRCGLSGGKTDIGIVVQTPPEFQKPAPGSPVTKDSIIAWSEVSKGIFRLTLSPVGAPITRVHPAIIVYLDKTETRWPDLRSMGLAFIPKATYECNLTSYSPYDSMDAMVTLKGLEVATGDGQDLRAQTMEVTTVQ